jgi:cytochrome c553
MMRAALIVIAASAWTLNLAGQDAQDVLRRGEEIYTANCATAYCHGPKGAFAGAPRLAARGFDAEFLNATIRGGIAGTAMTGFAGTLQASDLAAVVAYVASLNGIGTSSPSAAGCVVGNQRPLPATAVRRPRADGTVFRRHPRRGPLHPSRGRRLRSRAGAMTRFLPTSARARSRRLRRRPRPTTTHAGARGQQRQPRGHLHDLTTRPPVLRTAEQSAVKLTDGGGATVSARRLQRRRARRRSRIPSRGRDAVKLY